MSLNLLKEFKKSILITIDTKEHKNIYNVLNNENWNKIIDFINK